MMLVFVLTQLSRSSADYWLANWSEEPHQETLGFYLGIYLALSLLSIGK